MSVKNVTQTRVELFSLAAVQILVRNVVLDVFAHVEDMALVLGVGPVLGEKVDFDPKECPIEPEPLHAGEIDRGVAGFFPSLFSNVLDSFPSIVRVSISQRIDIPNNVRDIEKCLKASVQIWPFCCAQNFTQFGLEFVPIRPFCQLNFFLGCFGGCFGGGRGGFMS